MILASQVVGSRDSEGMRGGVSPGGKGGHFAICNSRDIVLYLNY
jgi:hypothetical protein